MVSGNFKGKYARAVDIYGPPKLRILKSSVTTDSPYKPKLMNL